MYCLDTAQKVEVLSSISSPYLPTIFEIQVEVDTHQQEQHFLLKHNYAETRQGYRLTLDLPISDQLSYIF